VSYESFLMPETLYSLKPNSKPKIARQLPARFDARAMTVDQFEATSKDGTKVPYFVIHQKVMRLDGSNPTLMYGYGGFNISETPFYSGSVGREWLSRGGVYVLTNIRGGGEFGPQWHQQGLKENRHKVFEDFISVGEDLVSRKITSPQHLGIMGGSNGGLLVGTAMTMRPDLFKAVVCQVPLLDMTRYHRLLAGKLWVDEYGDPDDEKMGPIIRSYSPYQNLKPGLKYPRAFFLTSTKDDRVHPGHARKMVAKFISNGYPVLYYENTNGGHAAAANLEERILRTSLEYTYLRQELMEPAGAPLSQ
jgi:prolyl oligopeptidase